MSTKSIWSQLTGQIDASVAAVMFLASTIDVAKLDVDKGPCAPTSMGCSPAISPLSQDLGETFFHTSVLLSVLSGEPPENALAPTSRSKSSTLSQCTPGFVAAMADANRTLIRLADEDDSRGHRNLPQFTRQIEQWDAAWRSASAWPRNARSMQDGLSRMGWARLAEENEEVLYVWHGPAVPMVTISHSG